MIATKMILVMVLSKLQASLEEGNLLSHHATSLNKFMVQELKEPAWEFLFWSQE